MLQWDKSITALHIPASDVITLFRSMREVQLALPGVPAQQTSAYLCQYRTAGGAATVVVFHMHKSEVLAFYPTDPRVVPESKLDSMLDRGMNFVESMGFLMTDQDIHLLDDSDQEMLWSSLPLKAGIVIEEAEEVTPVPAKPAPQALTQKPAPAKPASRVDELAQALKKTASTDAQPAAPPRAEPKAEPVDDGSENVDDLLAAVEAMRAKRPGLRARRVLPSKEEMERRKEHLRETVGRVWATL